MRYDLDIMGLDTGESRLSVTEQGAGSYGLHKLVQKVMILLLTDRTAPYSFGRGTSVPSQYTGANSAVADVVESGMRIALSQVKDMITESLPDDASPEETPKDLNVKATQNGPDGYTLEITVTSMAGESVTVPLPATSLQE